MADTFKDIKKREDKQNGVSRTKKQTRTRLLEEFEESETRTHLYGKHKLRIR